MNRLPNALRIRRHLTLSVLSALIFLANAAAQDATARKSFVEEVRRKVVNETANFPINGFNLTAEGPDSTFYVFHENAMTRAACLSLLKRDLVSKLQELGFVRLICTSDENATSFAFDLNNGSSPILDQLSSQETASPPQAKINQNAATQACPLSVTRILRGANKIAVYYENSTDKIITGVEFTSIFIDAVGNRNAGLKMVDDNRVKVGKKTHVWYAMYLYQDQHYSTELTLQKVAFENGSIWNRISSGMDCRWTSR